MFMYLTLFLFISTFEIIPPGYYLPVWVEKILYFRSRIKSSLVWRKYYTWINIRRKKVLICVLVDGSSFAFRTYTKRAFTKNNIAQIVTQVTCTSMTSFKQAVFKGHCDISICFWTQVIFYSLIQLHHNWNQNLKLIENRWEGQLRRALLIFARVKEGVF